MKDRVMLDSLGFSRWSAIIPDSLSLEFKTQVISRQDSYGYDGLSQDIIDWYVNFADSQLFIAYGTNLFAQDEIQVAEHPILAHLKEALLCIYRTSDVKYQFKPVTVDHKQPTPILITGADRLCKIHTGKGPGIPNGLYGNHFAKAPFDAITRATQVFEKPSKTNLICMAALKASWGRYTLEQIEYLLKTAYVSFNAARLESFRLKESSTICIHTGNWGCGAFGGNLELTAIIQQIAAKAANIDILVYHTYNQKGTEALKRGQEKLESIHSSNGSFSDLCNTLYQMEYHWGVSNGT